MSDVTGKGASLEPHAENCAILISLRCPIGIECEHGYDFCPICDACTCGASTKRALAYKGADDAFAGPVSEGEIPND